MRRVVVDMQNALFADAIAAALTAQQRSPDTAVYRHRAAAD